MVADSISAFHVAGSQVNLVNGRVRIVRTSTIAADFWIKREQIKQLLPGDHPGLIQSLIMGLVVAVAAPSLAAP